MLKISESEIFFSSRRKWSYPTIPMLQDVIEVHKFIKQMRWLCLTCLFYRPSDDVPWDDIARLQGVANESCSVQGSSQHDRYETRTDCLARFFGTIYRPVSLIQLPKYEYDMLWINQSAALSPTNDSSSMIHAFSTILPAADGRRFLPLGSVQN